MARSTSTVLQLVAILLVSLVVGSMFGIWRGYDPAAYSAQTFVEVHQGAVRGLNVLLPALAAAALLVTAALAVLARRRRRSLWLYLAAIVALAIGGVITRFFNQPINAQVMGWTADSVPANWMELRDSWWTWHILRLFAGVCGEIILIAAVFVDRDS
jgi:hypothetical protein